MWEITQRPHTFLAKRCKTCQGGWWQTFPPHRLERAWTSCILILHCCCTKQGLLLSPSSTNNKESCPTSICKDPFLYKIVPDNPEAGVRCLSHPKPIFDYTKRQWWIVNQWIASPASLYASWNKIMKTLSPNWYPNQPEWILERDFHLYEFLHVAIDIEIAPKSLPQYICC